jgi:hypothetical protein
MKKKITLLIAFVFAHLMIAFAQEVQVSGVVKHEKGEPLPGITVKVKVTNSGTVTSITGDYGIKAPMDALLSI